MMFAASKILSFAIEPLVWVLLALAAGVWLLWRRPRAGRAACSLALALLLLSGWEYPPNTMIRSLESRHPPAPSEAEMQRYTGIVVLGGALSNPKLWTVHRQVALNAQAERMTVAVALMRRHPQLKLLFTGGDAQLVPTGPSEAARARQFFDEMGVDASRVTYEDRSRNTHENAVFSAALPGVDRHQPWLLLTSAYHMPRAMGVFQQAGWNVRPYPVDYRSAGPSAWYDFSLHDGPATWALALHEWLGYQVYRIAGAIR